AQCLGRRTVEIRSDSEVVVRQVMGLSRVNSTRLRPLHRQTCARIAQFEQVRLHHVPREQNMMADALATLAAAGQLVRMP
ncbi:MAG: reverse transcriptase-like protein, partial [Anaerolineales bacterium]|nr:reverse transcriptase-like protein [Anaerolineales bacterium]